MLSQSTVGALLIIESAGLAATLTMLGLAIYAYKRANRELKYARKKAENARLSMKRFLDSCSAALDDN